MNEIIMQKILETQAEQIKALSQMVENLSKENETLKELCHHQQLLNDRQQVLLDELVPPNS